MRYDPACNPGSRDEVILSHVGIITTIAVQTIKRLGGRATISIDDLVQVGLVAFIGALDRHREGAGAASLTTFACIRVRGAMVDEYRKLDGLKTRLTSPIPIRVMALGDAERDVQRARDEHPSPEAAAATAERLALVRDSIEQLGGPARAVLCASMEGQPLRPVSESLGVGLRCVNTLRRQGIAAIRERLAA